MNNGLKKMGVLALMFVAVFAFAGLAEAAISITSTELNGKVVYDTSDTTKNLVRNFQRTDELEVSVELVSDVDVKNVEVKTELNGLEHDKDQARADTESFDMKAGVTYVKDLTITLPTRMEQGKTYTLRVRASGQSGSEVNKDYNIYVNTEMHGMLIKDVIFSPDTEVEAGRSLLTEVQVKNVGMRTEESFKVKVSIPDLGVSKSAVVDKLKSDETTTTEPLFIRIPDCAAKGSYPVEISIEYNDGDDSVVLEKTMKVVGSNSCTAVPEKTETKTQIALPSAQDVAAGSEVVFPILLTNAGSSSKTYSVVVRGAESWGTVRVEPGMTQVVNAGQTSAVYVYVTPNKDTALGQKVFFAEILSGSESNQVPLTANVVKASASASLGGVKKALEIGLIVFVVILVILGLIIGYNKMKDNGDADELDSEDGSSQTYY